MNLGEKFDSENILCLQSSSKSAFGSKMWNKLLSREANSLLAITGTETTAELWSHHHSRQLYSRSPLNIVCLPASLWPGFTMMPLSRSLDLLAHPNYPTMSSDVAMETSSCSDCDGGQQMVASTRFSVWNVPHAPTSPGVDSALTDTMTQLSLLLAWKLSLYI